MNAPLRVGWTPERFFAWAEAQADRYELDVEGPRRMTGGTINHGLIMRNLHRLLDQLLAGSRYIALGPDVGIDTGEGRIRYPDAVVTADQLVGTATCLTGAVAVFEIVSPGSERVDRLVKVREYWAMPSIRHYVVVESVTSGVTWHRRDESASGWIAEPLTEQDTLALPDLGLTLAVASLYDRVSFAPS